MISFGPEEKAHTIRCMQKHGAVLGYVFGSVATGTAGPDSDLDLAELFHTDSLHVIHLNRTDSPTLLHAVAFRGRVLFAEHPDLKSGFEKVARDAIDDSAKLRARSLELLKHSFSPDVAN